MKNIIKDVKRRNGRKINNKFFMIFKPILNGNFKAEGGIKNGKYYREEEE